MIAEGVEIAVQHEFLAAEGCSEVPGYLIGGPHAIETYAAVVGRETRMRNASRQAAPADSIALQTAAG